jgi:hypothetical protein
MELVSATPVPFQPWQIHQMIYEETALLTLLILEFPFAFILLYTSMVCFKEVSKYSE